MDTPIISISGVEGESISNVKGDIPKNKIEAVAEILLNDGLAILPTDTVYGLAALGSSPTARARLLALKPRPKSHPIAFLISSPEDIKRLGVNLNIKMDLMDLISEHWPGALTIVFERSPLNTPGEESKGTADESIVADESIAAGEAEFGEHTVGIRCPDYPWLNQLLALTGPLAVTSANLHNLPVPASIQDLDSQIMNGVDIIVDGGELSKTPSTVIDLSSTAIDLGSASIESNQPESENQKLRILREGKLKL